MQVIKKFEYEFAVYFDGTGDETDIRQITVISGEEYFSEHELKVIAERAGGYYAEKRRMIRSWYETV